MPGITITIEAQTAEAAKMLQSFANTSTAAFNRTALAAASVGKATEVSAAQMKTAGRALGAALQNLSMTAGMFAGPAVQQALYPAMLLGKEMKGIAAAMKLVGIGAGAASIGMAALAATVGTGVAAWGFYRARLQEVRTEMELLSRQRESFGGLIGIISGLETGQGSLASELAYRMRTTLANAQKPGPAYSYIPGLWGASPGMGGLGGGAVANEPYVNPIKTLRELSTAYLELIPRIEQLRRLSRLGDEEADRLIAKLKNTKDADMALSIASVQDRLSMVSVTKEQTDAYTELSQITQKNLLETLDGFDREREAANQTRRNEEVAIDRHIKLGQLKKDDVAVETARAYALSAYETKLADIQRRETEASATSPWKDWLLQLREIADESERIAKQLEAVRAKQISRIQSSPFLTESQKYGRLSGLGADNLGANPNSLPEQMSAAWVRLQNSIGTVSQNIAGLFEKTIGGAIDNISQGISGLIMGTQTWAGALRNIAGSVLQAVIDGIVRLFTSWITQRIALSAVEKTQGAADAAAKAPGALMDSISSWGLAAAVGAAALIAAMALIPRESGGPVTAGGHYLVGERGPEILVPASNGSIIPASQTRRTMSGGGSSGGGQINLTLHQLFDKAALARAMRDDIGSIALDAFRKNRIQLGFNT